MSALNAAFLLTTFSNFFFPQIKLASGEQTRVKTSTWTLTDRAVLARPALHALAVAVGVAGVVTQVEVPGPAEGGAGLAVVVLAAHHVVGEAQLALVAKVDVLRPVLAHRQLAVRRQPADQVVLVLCTTKYHRIQTKG